MKSKLHERGSRLYLQCFFCWWALIKVSLHSLALKASLRSHGQHWRGRMERWFQTLSYPVYHTKRALMNWIPADPGDTIGLKNNEVEERGPEAGEVESFVSSWGNDWQSLSLPNLSPFQAIATPFRCSGHQPIRNIINKHPVRQYILPTVRRPLEANMPLNLRYLKYQVQLYLCCHGDRCRPSEPYSKIRKTLGS